MSCGRMPVVCRRRSGRISRAPGQPGVWKMRTQQQMQASKRARGHQHAAHDPFGDRRVLLREPKVSLQDETLVESLILAQDQRWRRA